MDDAAAAFYMAVLVISWPFTARYAWRIRPMRHRTDDRERAAAIFTGFFISILWPFFGLGWIMVGPVSKALRWWMP